MKTTICLLAAIVLELAGPVPLGAKELADLKVLYVGSQRTADFVDFLKGKVAQVESKDREAFQPADADPFDVVLLDWAPSEMKRDGNKLDFGDQGLPLGARQDWGKSTVLLGSAGLLLAMTWQTKGGSGCTCLDPLAYDLREHAIFSRPIAVDRGNMISIPTPPGFESEIKTKEINVLALVDDRERKWHPGWCTHARAFACYPDVEFLCGGVNEQTPTSAALWRQGNLLHFGFDQSPREMNEDGRSLFLNSIAYISRFTEDRPIAITPSPFVGPVARTRASAFRTLQGRYDDPSVFNDLAAPEILKQVSQIANHEDVVKWLEEKTPFFHPNSEQKLEIDEDLVALGAAFDRPEFFSKAIADLGSAEGAKKARALRLLERYVPTGPQDGDAGAWALWWKENQPYAFASDEGNYRWYVDPLAKKRRVPQSELRGPKRADRM